ncbi:MAG: DUF115 domain-containing protein [Spirochaetaceae bacterium]
MNQLDNKRNGVSLHSKYSPEKEAQRFIDNNNILNGNTILILGPAFGYILSILSKSFPESEVISIPYTKDLSEISLNINNTIRKQYLFKQTLSDFLHSVITEKNIKGLQILEWKPTAKAYPDEALEVNNQLIKAIRRVNGNLLTTARFGKTWIRNSLKNYIITDNYITNFRIDKPVVIIASGKSLENSFELLKQIRDKAIFISLSSANKALEENDIQPDLTFSTDPGYYSKLHLYGTSIPITMPLFNSTNMNNTTLLINTGNEFENELIEMGKLPHIKLNENGTVAGTALEFALGYTKYPIYLFGQDLESSDIESHVRPYAFDSLLKSGEYRNNPHYSIMYKRYINSGVTFKTYRDWFSQIGKRNKGRIFRVNTISKPINNITDINHLELLKQLPSNTDKSGFNFSVMQSNNRKNRIQDVIKLCNNWLIKLNSEELIENHLFFLISTSIYTDINNKALSSTQILEKKTEGKREAILYIKRLLHQYGSKLLQQ